MHHDGLLRVPIVYSEMEVDSLSDLKRAHRSALDRIEVGKPLKPVDKAKVFERVFYESSERLLAKPYVVFELRQDEGNLLPYPQNKLIHIAGMVRHLAIEAMRKAPPEGADPDWIDTYVAGHVRAREVEHRQFSYLPVPSIGHSHTDPSVRRVLITAPPGDDRLLWHLATRLAGRQLRPTPETNLENPPTLVRVRGDEITRLYTEPASAWASVTPVILPGHDDHKMEKTRRLIEKALAQSGVQQPCEFEWSAFSRFPKSLPSHKYDRQRRPTGYIRPSHLLSQAAVHLTLRFNVGIRVPGPLTIGAGRHCGFGLMARINP